MCLLIKNAVESLRKLRGKKTAATTTTTAKNKKSTIYCNSWCSSTRRRIIRHVFILVFSIFNTVIYPCYYLKILCPSTSHKQLRQKAIPVSPTGNDTTPNVDQTTFSSSSSWVAQSPWDEPPEGFFGHHDTGSFQNCSSSISSISTKHGKENTDNEGESKPTHAVQTSNSSNSNRSNSDSMVKLKNGVGEGSIAISCQIIHFKAPVSEIQNSGPFIIGILSGASGLGPERRRVIRNTWASRNNDYRAKNNSTISDACHHDTIQREDCKTPAVFFIVAGPWEDVQEEFETYNDLIWIDEKEVYNGEKSVLTQKSFSFFTIAHLLARSIDNGGWRHAIKVDDDCYVNIKWIQEKLSFPHGEYHKLHYYGNCENRGHRPIREPGNKFSATYQMYPEPEFPTFCLGAGYGVSRNFVQSAVENNHISNIRRMAFEDVAMGMVAERMKNPDFSPTTINYVRNFRGNSKELNDLEKKCIQDGLPVSKCFEDEKWKGWWPPQLDLTDVMVQHRVDLADMVNIHKSFGYNVTDDIEKAEDIIK